MTVAQSLSPAVRRLLRHSLGVLTAACLPALVACSSNTGDPDGSLRGELHIYTIDYPDGHSVHDYYLAPNDHTPADTHLRFATDPGLDPWAKLKVWGEPQKDGTINVTRFEEVADEVGVATQAIVNPTKTTQTVGFVLMDIGNGVNIDVPTAQTAVFGTRTATQAGLNQFYTENSYGGLSFTGDVLGPTANNTIGTCQQSAVTAIEKIWPTQFGVTYDHWMTYIGSNDQDCGWSGLGGEGSAARPATGSWYNASTGCTVLAQEVGHNLGLMHSNSLRCPGAIFVDAPQGTCTAAEYGDRHTVMGQGCAHFNGYEKWYEGFFSGCNGVRATQSGTYTLLPTELACNGAQVLQIPMPKTRAFANTTGTTTVVNLTMYYLELRTVTSIDGRETLSVLVEVGADVPAATKTSQFTWVLDMNQTSTNTYDGMALGQTYTDPGGGVSFTVAALDANHADIQVTVPTTTAPTCIDGSAFPMPGPATCDGGVVGSGGAAGAGGSGGAGAGGAGAGGTSGTGAGGMGTSGAGGTGTSGAGGAGTAGAGTSGASGAGTAGAGTAGAAGAGTAGAGIAGAAGAGTAGAGTAGAGTAGAGTAGAGTAGAGTAGAAGAGTAGAGTAGAGAAGAAGNGAGATGGIASGGSAGAGVAGSTDPSVGSSERGAPPPLTPASPGCACRAAPAAGTSPGWLGLALLGLGLAVARKRRRAGALALRPRRLALGLSFAAGLAGCSSKSDVQSTPATLTGANPDCADAGQTLEPGFSVSSTDGYTFALTSIDPAQPVISSSAPGNTWKLKVSDSGGAPVAGSLLVSSYMPAHKHSGPQAVGIDLGNGSFEVDDLLLPMPALYTVTLTLTPDDGGVQEIATLSLCLAASSG